jgi:transcriptional regulator with XRE-family HTH domain
MGPEPIYKQIGRIIRARRRVLDRAQELLAQEVGISRATLANIETGRQRILVHQLYAFAKALDLKLSDLLPEQLPQRLAAEWSGAPIEGNLNAEQMNQVASLIEQVDTQPPKRMDGTDAKASTRDTRSPGTKATR